MLAVSNLPLMNRGVPLDAVVMTCFVGSCATCGAPFEIFRAGVGRPDVSYGATQISRETGRRYSVHLVESTSTVKHASEWEIQHDLTSAGVRASKDARCVSSFCSTLQEMSATRACCGGSLFSASRTPFRILHPFPSGCSHRSSQRPANATACVEDTVNVQRLLNRDKAWNVRKLRC